MGVAGIDAHSHGERILKLGFSMAKCSDIVAFEVGPDDTEAKAFNDSLVSLSDGLIPALSACRLVAVGGNHTNTFVRALKAGCRTPLPYLQGADGKCSPPPTTATTTITTTHHYKTGADGKLSASLLSAERPLLKQALDEGLKWFVLDHRLLLLCFAFVFDIGYRCSD